MTMAFGAFTLGTMLLFTAFNNMSMADLLLGRPGPGQPGDIIAQGAGSGTGSGGGSSPVGPGGFAHPAPGATVERTDQGKDFGAAAGTPIHAIGNGKMIAVGRNLFTGFGNPDGGAILALDSGPPPGVHPASKYIAIYEGWHPSVRSGQHVNAGDVIGHFGGPNGIEVLFVTSSGQPLTPYNGAPDGTPMPAGIAMAAFLASLHS